MLCWANILINYTYIASLKIVIKIYFLMNHPCAKSHKKAIIKHG